MDAKPNLIEPLLERAEQYGKTSFEILKLKALDKTADITSTVVSRLLLILVLSLFVITLNIALALWLGELLGKNYYGFLIVAGCHSIAAIILLLVHPFIKSRVSNVFINQILN